MRDPHEGLTADGYIKTGARRERTPAIFEPVIDDAIRQIECLAVERRSERASLYLYGSVATGRAVAPLSDVDLLSVGISFDAATHISEQLSITFRDICRAVEMAPAAPEDFEGETDEAYGGRIFLRHYCVHLWGEKMFPSATAFAGDQRAARAFNGDIAIHYRNWRSQMHEKSSQRLGRSLARKSLLAITGLISVHDHIWTTDRGSSAARWMELNPGWQSSCNKLIAWSDDGASASQVEIEQMLATGGLIDAIVSEFKSTVGLWPEGSAPTS